MFTGLIQAVGRLESREVRGGDQRLRFAFGSLPAHDIELGESIAVSGCCLTVVAYDARGFDADVSNESLALTTLGSLPPGAAVNLERSLLPTTRLGGHLVSGHVDGLGTVDKVWDDGRSQRWRFGAPRAVLRYVAAKGSIAVDGVSLTVNAVDEAGFEVNLVPHTVAHTAFGETAVGAAVNLEVDTIARYVERLLATREESA
ncbi:riboflavin synthase [Arenimonas sp. MALMAid1274]|uniref:riboflavin synthase n=1 Tax=Arenimonas sp. MALMAid1274 TaxID=3411630 RepID=UPI003BA3265C